MAEETRLEAYENAAGLLRNLGFEARADPSWTPPGESRPVTALITCAPPVILGYSIAITAENPEAHLPTRSAKAGRAAPGRPGDPQFGWF